jgi:hypothetical protein
LPDVAVTAEGAPGATTAITLVVDDVEVKDPASLVAVTTERIYVPARASFGTKVLDVAPLIVVHVSVEVTQLCHWYVRVGVGIPEKVTELVRVELTAAVPLGALVDEELGAVGEATVTVLEDPLDKFPA